MPLSLYFRAFVVRYIFSYNSTSLPSIFSDLPSSRTFSGVIFCPRSFESHRNTFSCMFGKGGHLSRQLCNVKTIKALVPFSRYMSEYSKQCILNQRQFVKPFSEYMNFRLIVNSRNIVPDSQDAVL